MKAVKRTLSNKLFWLAVLALVVTLSIVRAAQPGEGAMDHLSPTSNQPDGTRGLVLLLGELGTKTEVSTSIDSGVDTVLVLSDDLTRAQSDRLQKWTQDGGTLVLADPSSSLAVAKTNAGTFETRRLVPNCNSSFAAGVSSIVPEQYGLYTTFDVPKQGGVTACFPSAGSQGSYLVEQREGLGTLVQLGGPELFTNQQLRVADNAVLASNLLAGARTSTVTLLQGDTTVAPEGDKTLSDLVSDGVKQSLWQMAFAAMFLALWQGRRLGRVVPETPTVEIPASALVIAVGDLLQHAGQRNDAARTLRRDLHRKLAQLLGVAPDIGIDALAHLLHQRIGVDEARLQFVLRNTRVGDGDELLKLAQEIESLHREVAHAR